MSQILKELSGITGPEIIKSFTRDKDYPFFVYMCGTSQCYSTYNITRGLTTFYTIEYIISGTGYVQENDSICYPRAGDTHISHSGSTQHFATSPNDPWEKIWVIVSGPCADSLFELYDLNRSLHFPGLNLRDNIEEIISICNREMPQEEIFAKCSVITMEMIQKMYLYRLRTSEEHITISIADRLKILIDSMSDYNTSLDELASQVYCSKNHAIRLFKKKFNISPYQYMLNVRLKNAKKLLVNSNLSISDIAKDLSFTDVRYFSTWFKGIVHLTPKEYRAQCQDGPPKNDVSIT